MIASAKSGESQAIVSHDNGVPELTTYVVERWREVAWFHGLFSSTDHMKHARTAKDTQLDMAVCEETQTGTSINSTVLSIQAQNYTCK